MDHVLALAHRLPGSTIDPVPKLFDLGMGGTPLQFELLDFGVT